MIAYIASGWFTPEQEDNRQILLNAAEDAQIEVFSPKDDLLYIPDGLVDAKDVLHRNILEIRNSDFVLASTTGKDMGTVFELGAAFMLKKPTVLYWNESFPLNLMLAESASIVAFSVIHLRNILFGIVELGYIPEIKYTGEME